MTIQYQSAPNSGGITNWAWDDAAGEEVPVSGNSPLDLNRGIGRLTSLQPGTTTAYPNRVCVNQTLPTGLLLIQSANGPETNTFTTRVNILNAALLNCFNPGSFGTTAAALGANTLPAGILSLVGRSLHFKATGTLGTTGTPNYTIDVGLGVAGANVLATTGALAMATATTPAPWSLDIEATVQTAGSSGVVIANGIFQYSTTSSVVVIPWTMGNTVRGTGLSIDLTAAYLITLNATSSASNALNRIICNTFSVELKY